MLRTYTLSFASVLQGSIEDVSAENMQQVILLAPSLAEAKEKLLSAVTPEDVPTIQFTDQCREICENDVFPCAFEGWLTTA